PAARGQPSKVGHAVPGTADVAVTRAFFLDGLGFKLSDSIKDIGAFMRCSTDHHNVLVLQAPVGFLHHTSWEVDDIDEVGRGAAAMLEDHPERHIWGLGRHHAGSNFFWYLKDPAGNFSEYYSDLDCIADDQLWTPEAASWTSSPTTRRSCSPSGAWPPARSRSVSCLPTSGARCRPSTTTTPNSPTSSPARTSSSWRAPATGSTRTGLGGPACRNGA